MAQLSSTKIYGNLTVSDNIFSKGTKVSLETHNHENLYFNKVRGNVSDFNNCLAEGQYLFGSGSTIPNGYWSSGGRYGTLVVYVNDGGTHNNSNNWIWQVAYDTSNTIWWRNKVNNAGWGGWQQFSASHSHNYLPLSGGTMTENAAIAKPGATTSWSEGNKGVGSFINQTTYRGWAPIIRAKSTNGVWTSGLYAEDKLYLNYTNDTHINSGINSCNVQIIFYPNGNIQTPGTITGSKVYNAVYNDYAEWFERKDKNEILEPGDIVVSNNNTYTKSTKAYQSTVVGVYSDSYGHIVGGEKLDNMEDNIEKFIPLGLSGRVDVKVIGSIKEGDLIVSSDIPGVGMKMENFIPGTIIGKAVEDKNNEEIGKVKILIMQM